MRPLRLSFDPIQRAADLWRHRWGECDEMRVATSIMRAQQLLLARYDELLRPRGLTFARYEALVLLRFSQAGALPLGKVGERLMVHPTSVTSIVDRLERQGFVRRQANPRDRRGVLAEITEAGIEVVEAATRDLMGARFGLAALTGEQRQAVFDALRALRVAAGDFPA